MKLFLKSVIFVLLLPLSTFADDALKSALSNRHEPKSIQELERLAGGEEELISQLLELRKDDSIPYISVRAVKCLLLFSDREEVQKALLEDLGNEQKVGLARTIMLNLESAPNESSRIRLAEAGLDRARSEATFEPFARSLLNSKDDSLKRLARARFKAE